MDATEIRKYMAELVGTFVLVVAGVGTAVMTAAYGTFVNVVATALAFGLSVVVMSVTVGQISGCHLNPAVSLGMALDKRITWTEFVFYFIFQVIGAILGALIVVLFAMGYNDAAMDELTNVGANGLSGVHDSVGYAFLVEIILTFIFVLVALGATAKNGMDKFAGLYIGLALTMVHFVGIPLTGTSVNPARSIGPAIFDAIADIGNAGDVWIFIIAPLIGAVIAWAVWKYVLCDPKSAEA
ncbi:MAG: MIP/aquaporin family protein [Methanomethylophilus sp.]|jgi:aquaporin Z